MLAAAIYLFSGAITFKVKAQTYSPNAAAKGSARLRVEDFLDWEYVAAPQISPDGSQVAYMRHTPDKVNDRYEDEIWLVSTDGTHNRFLVKGGSPRWSPDGRRIAFVAPAIVNGQPAGAQIFVKYMDAPLGDAPTQITRVERAPSNLAWSPDGRRIAFTMNVPATNSFVVKMPARPNGAKWIDSPRVVDRLDYRSDGSGFRPEGFAHIFLVSTDAGNSAPRQLTSGGFNHSAPAWMQDSMTLVFSAIRKPDAEYLRDDTEIYSLNTQSGEIKQLTDRKGPDLNPTVSPDGKMIAYIGHDQNDDTYNVFKLYVMNADGSDKRALTETLDRSPADLKWSRDGKGVYFTCEDKGSSNVHYVSAKGGAVKQLTQGAQLLSLASMSDNGTVAGLRTTYQTPADVVVIRNLASNVSINRITNVNDDVLEGKRLGDVEEIWYDSVGGKRIQGWIVKPPDFDSSKKYPLILYIHGGPHAMYGVGFNFEFQNHAAENYVVLYTNPRGSSGYGKEFGNAINNNYPGEDYDDLMNGVNEVLKRGYVDERNLFVTGGSGGGVLTSWIVGHTDRFAAAVVMKPVINWYSFVGTTDGADWYYNFKQLPWVDPQEHLRRSPITYVGNVKTPTMLITGELDLRTPMEQTEQFYRALKMRKVPTAMVRLADEYHGFNGDFSLRHPSNRISQILYLRGWFERYKRPSAQQAMMTKDGSTNETRKDDAMIEARRVGGELNVADFDNAAWNAAQPIRITRYWSGADAAAARHAEARALWSDAALYVRFIANQNEPLIVSDKPQTLTKTLGLWDRDVCEIFVAPDSQEPSRYFEFEVAPTGEWVDLKIHQMPDKRETDFDFHSGMTAAARIEPERITLTLRIPFKAFGKTPRAGDEWRANLFRCIGLDSPAAPRGYLAWRPTETPAPNFHVPQRFGRLRFV